MNDLAPPVFQPPDGDGEWAIVIERGDCVLLRELFRKAASDRHKKAARAVQGQALGRNVREYHVFTRYADRCEHIRKQEVAVINEKLGIASQS